MPKLIKDGELIDHDDWRLIEKDTAIDDINISSGEKLLIPFAMWNEQQETFNQINDNIGIWFDSDESPALLEIDANSFPLIALNFPVFRDGRAFSYAAILRQQLNYEGDMRAIGDVQRDQASYMLSCGFSSFLVPEGVDANVLLGGFQDFSENYQSTVINPSPIFRRRS